MEIEPEQSLGLWGVVVSIAAIAAILGVVIIFPVIDRWIRPKFDLSRGGAMLLLLASGLAVGFIGGVISFSALRDHPDYQPKEPERPAEEAAPAND